MKKDKNWETRVRDNFEDESNVRLLKINPDKTRSIATTADIRRFLHYERLAAKKELLEEIMTHKFNTFTAKTMIMLGEKPLSVFKEDVVIDVNEFIEYLQSFRI